jgi:hypothetical protein
MQRVKTNSLIFFTLWETRARALPPGGMRLRQPARARVGGDRQGAAAAVASPSFSASGRPRQTAARPLRTAPEDA